MKAIRISGYHAEPVLDDIARPDPAPGQVLVRVQAASLNPLDVKLQRGRMETFFPLRFPYTLGTDLAGVIEQVGADVEGWSVGDRIVARTDPTEGGAFADYAVVPADHLATAPAGMPVTDVAGVPTAAATAWQALFETADLSAGQSILIHAGAGGVGSFAVQFARQVGARVIATASGAGLAIVRRLGADTVIDHRSQDFVREVSDVDVVLDTIGGDTQQRSFETLRAGGQLVSIAGPPDDALAKARDVSAGFVFHASDGRRLTRVADGVRRHGLTVLVDRHVPLSRFHAAFERQASGRAKGKIIVTPR